MSRRTTRRPAPYRPRFIDRPPSAAPWHAYHEPTCGAVRRQGCLVRHSIHHPLRPTTTCLTTSVCSTRWRSSTEGPADAEARLIRAFMEEHGQLPFATSTREAAVGHTDLGPTESDRLSRWTHPGQTNRSPRPVPAPSSLPDAVTIGPDDVRQGPLGFARSRYRSGLSRWKATLRCGRCQ